MTAAATTGPNNDPRPTSSTPAMYVAPAAQARFSNLRVQRSFFSKRNLAVAAETPSAFEAFDVRANFEADLDTDADQHLRRRSGAKQEQMFDDCVEAKWGFATLGRVKAPSPHNEGSPLTAVRLLSAERPCP